MTHTEDALIASIPPRRFVPRPSVIELAREALGRENTRVDCGGAYYIWRMGGWRGPLKLVPFVKEANVKLKAEGKPQILGNTEWIVQ